MSNPRNRDVAVLMVATMLSGAAALVYETLWTRSFALMLGSTVQAAAATFAAFLVGLALGSWIAGTLVARVRALECYVAVELGIAVTAGGTGLLLHELRDVLPSLIGVPAATWRSPEAFLLTLGLVLLPTLLMGATFPIILALARARGATRLVISRIYSLNTAGGALGTLVCGFFTLRLLGARPSLGIAALLNIASALLVLGLRRRPVNTLSLDETPESELVLNEVPSELVLLITAAFSGASVLAFEVVWTRFATYVLGNRIFAFTTLLGWVLVLLSAGAALSGRLLRRRVSNVRRLLGQLLLATPIAVTASTLMAHAWILHRTGVELRLANRDIALLLLRIAGVGFMMSPALVILGVLFPLALTCSRESVGRVGRAAGRFYLWNTAGSVVGSLATGFVGIPSAGVFACAALLAIVSALLALVLLANDWSHSRRTSDLLGVAAAAAMLAGLPQLIPDQLVVKHPDEDLLFRREDQYGVFQVMRRPNGRMRTTNNNTELVYHLGASITSYVQQMQGHLGMLARPRARTALVLGSGYGITAGALATYPSLERIDAVEIVPSMVEASALFEPYNLNYRHDPRVHIFVDDGRQFLARTSALYDIISINVSDPHLPGGASLFTHDFYEIVKRHLNPGGVAILHAFGTDKNIVLSTLQSSFSNMRLYRAYGASGFNVVAADHSLEADEAMIRQVTSAPAVQAALKGIEFKDPIDAVQIYNSGSTPASHADLFDPRLVARDDKPLLEFSTSGRARLMFFSNE